LQFSITVFRSQKNNFRDIHLGIFLHFLPPFGNRRKQFEKFLFEYVETGVAYF
jgi:hypothetical protein